MGEPYQNLISVSIPALAIPRLGWMVSRGRNRALRLTSVRWKRG